MPAREAALGQRPQCRSGASRPGTSLAWPPRRRWAGPGDDPPRTARLAIGSGRPRPAVAAGPARAGKLTGVPESPARASRLPVRAAAAALAAALAGGPAPGPAGVAEVGFALRPQWGPREL